MNFFEHQVQARRKTALLALYYLLAMLAIVAAVNLAIALLLALVSYGRFQLPQWLHHPAAIWVTGTTLAIMILGALHKAWQLRGGGVSLAQMVGANRVSYDSRRAHHAQLINVVEEMSLAAGLPAPQLFVLEKETAINAFVAGRTASEAALVVTRGCLDQLDRNELQGVIAHEFSHIFNADMRLNLRLMAVLAGILSIGKTGELLLRHTSTHYRRRGSIQAVLGVALMGIGYVGLFCARLIKAAISRQRELLADASAVQFTRQTEGLAGALIKIRNGQGSHLRSRFAEDMSHMCFSDTLSFRLRAWLATHPPIDTRLQALGRDWVARARVRARVTPAPAPAAHGGPTPAQTGMAFASVSPQQTPPAPVANEVGHIEQQDLDDARQLLAQLPRALYQLTRETHGAQVLTLALAVNTSRRPATDLVAPLDSALRQPVIETAAMLKTLPRQYHLPLMELALPTLRQLTPQRQVHLRRRLKRLSAMDQRHTLFEWSLLVLVQQQLERATKPPPRVRYHRLTALGTDLHILFSVLAWAGTRRDKQARAHFAAATHGLFQPPRELLTPQACTRARLHQAIGKLQELTPILKQSVLNAAADLILADERVTVAEADLLRTVALLLDCPLPLHLRPKM